MAKNNTLILTDDELAVALYALEWAQEERTSFAHERAEDNRLPTYKRSKRINAVDSAIVKLDQARRNPSDSTLPAGTMLLLPDPALFDAEPLPFKMKAGYYQRNQVVNLLRKHKDNPEAIAFIADMLEE